MAARVIQNFVAVCDDCPNCNYYSGGMYECSLTDERIKPDDRKATIGKLCPLPFAGPFTAAPASAEPTPAEIARSFWKGDGLPAGYASGWNDACETIARELESPDPCLVK